MSGSTAQIPPCPIGARLIPLTQGKFAIVDEEDFDSINKYKWCIHSGGYAFRHDSITKKWVFLHHFLLNAGYRKKCDHINRDKLDNRKSNLREATTIQNAYNQLVRINNKLGVKGVCWNKKCKKYQAQITLNGKNISLGYYDTINEASLAYIVASKLIHKEFSIFKTLY